MNSNNVAYENEVWDRYARAFLAIMSSSMLELNKAVAELSMGNVCDFGCGTAKVSPFVLCRPQVTSYTGIDYSLNMVELARWHLEQFPGKPSQIIQGKIEDVDLGIYDSGLSINSYYTWDSPSIVLQSIYKALKPGANFILVTPNPFLNMQQILEEVKREQVANPYFESFKEQNMALASNEKAMFVEMDELIEQVQQVGFSVIEANQSFYNNGLNFLSLCK